MENVSSCLVKNRDGILISCPKVLRCVREMSPFPKVQFLCAPGAAEVNFGANRKLCCLSLKFNLSLSRSVLEIRVPFLHTQVLSSVLQRALALEVWKVPAAYFCITWYFPYLFHSENFCFQMF